MTEATLTRSMSLALHLVIAAFLIRTAQAADCRSVCRLTKQAAEWDCYQTSGCVVIQTANCPITMSSGTFNGYTCIENPIQSPTPSPSPSPYPYTLTRVSTVSTSAISADTAAIPDYILTSYAKLWAFCPYTYTVAVGPTGSSFVNASNITDMWAFAAAPMGKGVDLQACVKLGMEADMQGTCPGSDRIARTSDDSTRLALVKACCTELGGASLVEAGIDEFPHPMCVFTE